MAAGKHVVPGILLAVVGLVFIGVAVFQPAFLWDMGKVRTGREAIGDTGTAIFFGVVGAALAAVGLVHALRR
jgi:hypothetical protein